MCVQLLQLCPNARRSCFDTHTTVLTLCDINKKSEVATFSWRTPLIRREVHLHRSTFPTSVDARELKNVGLLVLIVNKRQQYENCVAEDR